MIGWYVHDHGLGHLHRMQSIAAHLDTPVTPLSSLPAPAGWGDRWLPLASDRPVGGEADQDAGGTLHWAPRHHPGLLRRGAQIAAWVQEARPRLVVVDVSVEVAVLVRSLGVPVVVAAMRGDRTDRPHRTAYDLADHLLAPWPASLPEDWPRSWADKAWHTGALSRLDGRPVVAPPGERRVALLWGRGGSGVTSEQVAAARAQSPGWTWDVLGLDDSTWADDPWERLQAADVVVTHAGQNALAEVAAARRPAVVVPQDRPHDEQQATGRALVAGRLAEVCPTWPDRGWGDLLERTAARDGARWQTWSDGHGAQRAARLLDDAAGGRVP